MRIHLASGDLQARARLEAAVEKIGAELTTGAAVDFGSRLDGVDVLILDLDAGRDEAIAELGHAAAVLDEMPRRVIGFFSHIDTELEDTARAAGIEPIRRGQLWRDPEQVLRS